MTENRHGSFGPWQGLDGPNLGYLIQLYDQYLQAPTSVPDEIRTRFEQWGAPPYYEAGEPQPAADISAADLQAVMQKTVAAVELTQNIRLHGHLSAHTNSFADQPEAENPLLNPASYGLSQSELASIPAQVVWADAPAGLRTAAEVIAYLRKVYTGTTAYHFVHITNAEERKWLTRAVEMGEFSKPFDPEARINLLRALTDAEEFEHYLQKTFTGQKRFSAEGLESLVPMLLALVDRLAADRYSHLLIGMAHRGRLNVLAHVLGKPLEKIFAEFHHTPVKDMVPSEGSMGVTYGWTGDVKYHLGASRSLTEGAAGMRITMADNPSHLEFVGPVVAGFTRAAQETRRYTGLPHQDWDKALCVSIHGDAAFPGEGVVAETLNLSRLRGYNVGGTLHIITNNQLGFTTDSADSRSTRYSSSLARGLEIPIVRVNADDPEACLRAVELAYAYRTQFHKDFLIEIVGFRRYGHNEADDPMVTQPVLYAKVNRHPGVRHLYAARLLESGVITEQLSGELQETSRKRLQEGYDRMVQMEAPPVTPPVDPDGEQPHPQTAVPLSILSEFNRQLLERPADFKIYPKLARIFDRRTDLQKSDIDWAHAETLAFATILADGIPIRMTGQDTERGTFAQRNLVLHDTETGAPFVPLQHFPGTCATFAIYNSPLSETAVMGFEYGYDVLSTDTLVIWEAQFGDFANVAQVIVDQFLSAGRAKWGQRSNLVLLLPHGYEGMGPEHSSARLERYLQLSAEQNWTVANLTRSSQYFHLLRRQAAQLVTENARPLVLMSPKSLLREPRAASPIAEFTEGEFQPVLEQPGCPIASAKRLVLSTGKIGIELEAAYEAEGGSEKKVAMVRVEQLYPFPRQALLDILGRARQLKEILWVQEEPQNMGAWTYMEPRLRELTAKPVRYVGRPERSSPAEGSADAHKAQQREILREAFLMA